MCIQKPHNKQKVGVNGVTTQHAVSRVAKVFNRDFDAVFLIEKMIRDM